MANEKPLKVDDHVIVTGSVYKIVAIDGDIMVLQGVVSGTGGTLTGKITIDRRVARPQKVSLAFVTALKGTS